MPSRITPVRGYTCAQIYSNKSRYIKSYTMDRNDKKNLGNSLSLIIQDGGVMKKINTENAPKMVGRKTPFFKRARKEGID